MTKYSEHKKTPDTDICQAVDGQRPINKWKPTEMTAKLTGSTQEVDKNQLDVTTTAQTHKTTRSRASAYDYEQMEAAAWASCMYDICGGDGEGNAYLSDGISITPDGRLVDD